MTVSVIPDSANTTSAVVTAPTTAPTPTGPAAPARPARDIRRKAIIATTRHPFVTELGERLDRVEIVYETWGRLNPSRDNVVLVTHALTGDSQLAAHFPGDEPGWWEPLVGPGRPIDTNRYFVICSNMLGSCYGSTGPNTINPRTGRRYNLDFPSVTVRDIVRAQYLLLEHLGINHLHAVVGGSLGGMQVIEWAAMFPDRVDRIVPIATSGRFNPQGIAYNEVQRRAIMLDPAWEGGNYPDDGGPETGLSLARMVGMITYQSEELMAGRFGRNPATRYTNWPEFHGRYDIEGYLHYQGHKLARRFDANSYLYLTRAMDSHDVGRDRGGYESGLARIQARALLIAIRSDILFWPQQSREVVDILRALGRDARYHEVDSPNGHDAFLKDFDLFAPALKAFIEEE